MDKPLSLSTAYASWVLDTDENKWVVRDQEGKELWKFPRDWDESDCMTAIRMGRHFELIAFNEGIKLGKQELLNTVGPVMDNLRNNVTVLEQMNIKLSNKLENFIIGDGNGIN